MIIHEGILQHTFLFKLIPIFIPISSSLLDSKLPALIDNKIRNQNFGKQKNRWVTYSKLGQKK